VLTFADYAARRQARKGLQDGRAAVNDFIRARAPRHTTPEETEARNGFVEAGRQLAAMDQGSRGRPPAPEPTNNDRANAYLRAAFRREPLEADEDRSTSP
jgi:hypothetical protein